MVKWLALALAGGLGTLARYSLGGWVQRQFLAGFPWGTMAVNLSGCFAFGLVWAFLEDRVLAASAWRTILLVGFMGGYTTFSSFVFESGQLLRDSQWWWAAGNIAAQNAGGLLCLWLGWALGKIV